MSIKFNTSPSKCKTIIKYDYVGKSVNEDNTTPYLLASGLWEFEWLVNDYKAAYTPYELFTCESYEIPSSQ